MNLSTLASGGRIFSFLRSSDHRASLLRGTAGSFLNKVAANGLLFISQILFARTLGLQDYGIYVVALAWLSVLVLFGRLGFDMATVRFVAGFNSQKEFGALRGFLIVARTTAFGASLLVSGAIAAIVMLCGDSMSVTTGKSLLIVALIIPLFALVQIEAAAIRGLGRVVLGDIPLSIGHPLILIGTFFLLTEQSQQGSSAETALYAYLIATGLTLLALWPAMARLLPRASEAARRVFRWREWTGTALMMTMIAGFGVMLAQMSTIVTGWLAGPETAGLFGAAGRLASTLLIVSFSLCTAIAPLAAGMTDRHRLQESLNAGLKAIMMASVAVALILLAFGDVLLGLFGEAFTEASGALAIMVLGQLVAAAAAPAGIVLNMLGGQRQAASILAGAVIVNLCLLLVLVPPYGLIGAATATALTTACCQWIMALATRTRFGLSTAIGLRAKNIDS